MSALQPPEPDPSFLDAVAHYAPVGAAASLCRALLTDKPTSLGWIVRRTLAASITAWMVGPAIQSQCPSNGLTMACVGAISYAAPEVWDWVGKKTVAVCKGLLSR